MKKMALFLVGVLAMLSLAGTAQAPKAPPRTGGLEGRILGVLEIPKTEIPSPLSASQKEEIAAAGWVETATAFRKEGGLRGVRVSVGNYTTVTDADWYYKLEGIPAGSHQLRVIFAGETLAERSVVVIAGRLRSEDIYAVHRIMDQPHACGMHATGRNQNQIGVTSPPGGSICLDYNGPFGNPYCVHVHTPWNFFLSDCDQAFFAAGCWRDFTPWPYCNSWRNCSPFIGHSSSHHCH